MKNFKTFLNESKDKEKKPKYYDNFIGNVKRLDAPADGYHETFIGNVKKLDQNDKQGTLKLKEETNPKFPGFHQEYIKISSLPHAVSHRGLESDFDPDKSDHVEYPSELEDRLHDKTMQKLPTGANKTALQNYTGSSYSRWNRGLLGLGNQHDYLDSEDQAHIERVKDELGRHTTDEDMYLYSGIKYHPFKHPITNGIIRVKNKAFTSLSTRYNVASGFASLTDAINPDGSPIKQIRTYYNQDSGKEEDRPDPDSYLYSSNIVRVNVPKGSHGMYVDPVSSNAGEKEFLLHPNSKFHINPIPRLRRGYSGGNEIIKIWDAKLVHDGVNNPEDDPRQMKFNFGDK